MYGDALSSVRSIAAKLRTLTNLIVVLVTTNRRPKEGIKSDIGAAHRRATGRARSLWAAPIVLDRIDYARTCRGLIEGADITHANFVPTQVVQMDIHFGGSIHRYINVLVADYIVGNYRSANGRAATAAVDVDSHPAWRGRVVQIREIFRNVVP